MRCDGFPNPGCLNEATSHIGHHLCGDCARAFVPADLQPRLDVLREILTDPVNQLEQTKGGYYIYRFDLETMHRIADALGIPKPGDVLACFTPSQLPMLIRPE